MNYDWIDSAVLAQKSASKEWKEEWAVFRFMVGGKMFGMAGQLEKENNRPIITLKLVPEEGEFLRGQYPGKIIPGYYMNKEHWNTVYLDTDVPKELVQDMIVKSYGLILSSLSKKAQKEILG